MATVGVLRHLRPFGDSMRRSLADSRYRVEVLPMAELKSFVAGLIISVLPEPVAGAAVGNE